MQLKRHSPDYIFILSVVILLIFGLAALISASSVISFKISGNSYDLVKRQIVHGLIPGLILFFIFYKINYEQLKKLVFPLLVVSLLLLIIVLIPSIGLNEGAARSWLGIGGVTFQPSELAKLSFILYLSLWFSKRKDEEIIDYHQGLLPFVFLLGSLTLLILLQPDFGTAIVIIATSLMMYILAGAKKSHIILLLVVGIIFSAGLMQVAKPYQKERLTTFLNPQYDIQGNGYHINQAFLAVGSGGLFGVGFGQSKQKFMYLPKVENDSIFAVIAEELGFIVCLLFLTFLCFLVFRGFEIAKYVPDNFSFYVVTGIMIWFILQSVINISAMVGLLPLTGVTLPLVSSGGSSMAIFLASFGIVAGISRYTKK